MTDPIKSMAVFFIDNQQSFPEGAKLHGSLVAWPDNGKYPSYIPVGVADHPQFSGKMVMQAGNRGLVVSLVAGAKSLEDVRKGMSAKGLEQYRISVESILHAIMLMRADTEGLSEGDLHPIAILTILAKSAPKEANIIGQALTSWMRNPEMTRIEGDQAAFVATAEEMRDAIDKALNG